MLDNLAEAAAWNSVKCDSAQSHVAQFFGFRKLQ
jgi:hypothetical protein